MHNRRNPFIHRSWMKKQGHPEALFDGRPVIDICNTFSELRRPGSPASGIVTGSCPAQQEGQEAPALCGRRCAPLRHGGNSEDAESATGDEVTLCVEGVVDGRMEGKEPLG